MSKATISGIWSGISFYCGNHPDLKLQLNQGAYSAYYGCEHEYDEDYPCHNRLNLIDAEKAVQHIMDIVTDYDFFGNRIDITNHTWSKNGLTFKVLKYDGTNLKIDILVNNKKILRNSI